MLSTVIFGIFNIILTVSTMPTGFDAIEFLGWSIEFFMIVITYLLWRFDKKQGKP
jgi:hypothetical protein